MSSSFVVAIVLSIGEIMTRDVFTLPDDWTAEEAAWALTTRGLSGAPVRDRTGRLVGVLSRSDLTDPERCPASHGSRTVRDLMTPALLSLEPGAPAMRAVALMVRQGVHRILVMDPSGELVGIVTPVDVLRALAAGFPLEGGDEVGARSGWAEGVSERI